jgi:response regulator RpfG family c-di-GMP phosphodiesterase
VLDDQRTVRSVTSRTLHAYGFRVVEAETVEEAARMADELPITAFVVDLHLADGRSGLEFIEWLRGRDSYEDALVFLVTGALDLQSHEQEAIARAGAHVFLKEQSPRLLAEEIHWRLFTEPEPPA